MAWRTFAALLLILVVVFLPSRGLGDDPPPESRNEPTYMLRSSVMGAAGGPTQNGVYGQRGTLGQPTPVGTPTGSGFSLHAGVWKDWAGPATGRRSG